MKPSEKICERKVCPLVSSIGFYRGVPSTIQDVADSLDELSTLRSEVERLRKGLKFIAGWYPLPEATAENMSKMAEQALTPEKPK